MLIPELSILIAAVALLVTLAGCLYSWWLRRDIHAQFRLLQQEQKAVNSATFGLARHMRRMQLQLDQANKQSSNDSIPFSKADALSDEGLDTLQLADELGLSHSEAEIITHLRPKRSGIAKSA